MERDGAMKPWSDGRERERNGRWIRERDGRWKREMEEREREKAGGERELGWC